MRFAKKIHSLKSKIWLSYLFLNLISISLFSWVISINQLELISTNTRYSAKELIHNVVSSLQRVPIASTNGAISESERNKSILEISKLLSQLIPQYVIFQENEILYYSEPRIPLPANSLEQAEKAAALVRNSGMSSFFSLSETRTDLQVYVPLESIGLNKVTLFIQLSLSPVQKQYQDLYKQIGITIIGLTLLHFLFGWFIFRKIVKPIIALKIATGKIANGDYSIRVKESESNEIGELAVGFNQMSSTIQDAFSKLEKQMTELKSAQGKIEKMAITDELTSLSNRRFFFDLLRKHVSNSYRNTRPLSVVLMDIDHFKQINDHYGHIFGDKVLREIGAVLPKTIRDGDVVARYGGEEIVVLFPETDITQAILAAEKIRKAIESWRFELPTHDTVTVTASFGVAELHSSQRDGIPESTDLSVAFLECADKALYQAKHNGRNQVAVFGAGAH